MLAGATTAPAVGTAVETVVVGAVMGAVVTIRPEEAIIPSIVARANIKPAKKSSRKV